MSAKVCHADAERSTRHEPKRMPLVDRSTPSARPPSSLYWMASNTSVHGRCSRSLFQIDPIAVHGQDDIEKFVPEAASILARLRDARIAEDVEQMIQQEL